MAPGGDAGSLAWAGGGAVAGRRSSVLVLGRLDLLVHQNSLCLATWATRVSSWHGTQGQMARGGDAASLVTFFFIAFKPRVE